MSDRTVLDELVGHMVDMGFDADQARSALVSTNGDIERAIELLSGNPPRQQQQQQQEESSNNRPVLSLSGQQQQQVYYNPFGDDNSTDTAAAAAATSTSTSIHQAADMLISQSRLRGETEDDKLRFKEKLRLENLERQKREKREKQQQLKLLRDQIAVEREARARKNGDSASASSSSSSAATATGATAATGAPAATVAECSLQIRLPDSTTLKHNFQSTQTLLDVARYVAQNASSSSGVQVVGSFSFVQPFPRKEFPPEQLSSVSLADAKLVPRGSLIVQLSRDKGKVIKAEHVEPQRLLGNNDDDDEVQDDDDGTAGQHRRGFGPGRRLVEHDDDDDDSSSDAVDRRGDAMHDDDEHTGASSASAATAPGQFATEMELLTKTDMWYVSESSAQANASGSSAAASTSDAQRTTTLILRPSSADEFKNQSSAKRDAVKFLRSGLFSHTGLNTAGIKTTTTMNYSLQHGPGSGKRLDVVDTDGNRHQIRLAVLTASNLIIAVPHGLFPALDARFSRQ